MIRTKHAIIKSMKAVVLAAVGLVLLIVGVSNAAEKRELTKDHELCQVKTYIDLSLNDFKEKLISIKNINAPNCRHDETILFKAAPYANVKIIQHLLNIGADPKHMASDKCTAICRAVGFDNTDSINVLLKQNTDLSLYNPSTGSIFDRLFYYARGDGLSALLEHPKFTDPEYSNKIWMIAIQHSNESLFEELNARRKNYPLPQKLKFQFHQNKTTQEFSLTPLNVALIYSQNANVISEIALSAPEHEMNYSLQDFLDPDENYNAKIQNLLNEGSDEKSFKSILQNFITQKDQLKMRNFLQRSPLDKLNEILNGDNLYAILYMRSLNNYTARQRIKNIFGDHETVYPFALMSSEQINIDYPLIIPIIPTDDEVKIDDFHHYINNTSLSLFKRGETSIDSGHFFIAKLIARSVKGR